MENFELFTAVMIAAIAVLLAICVVFLAVTAYSLSLAVISRPDIDESLKTLPRKYVRFSAKVMASPSVTFALAVKLAFAGLTIAAVIYWTERLLG